ncbi:MAG: hypothetical protein HHJ12_19250 [Glaciimonas sp.]|nr:hypothetical protein [Glaciimonas sp.]
MIAVSLSSPSPSIVTTVATQMAPTATAANPITQPAKQSGDTAIISGHAMLLLRLFRTKDPQAQPPVEFSFGTQNLSGNSSAGFLKMNDRQLIERAYEYATASGMDPVQVDGLAFHLANYRFLQITGNNTGEDTGLYDLEGNPWVGKFNAHDAELAKRMLTSQAINETDMDTGFLADMLNPQSGGGGNPRRAVSFESLEKFISALSPSGGKPSPDGKASEPVQPTDAGFTQALYRIDHPYVGVKWVPSKPQDSADQPLKHLSKSDINQLMAAYKFALLQGSAANLKSLDRMSALAGIVQMQKDGNLNGGSQSPQAAIERLGHLLQSITKPDAYSSNKGVVHSLLSVNSHIDTSV